ncbi:penicillin-binding protein, beta-lactamase class C [Bernardetia litoralis DSM 6794]|uniref:Penicillin-binding protein, beta-lactamase class C n=1 Tax=Bernardetia litoralis (strain ATCC 23117 / DSM 6794 / NBRC 15988 / NCIMB 1366 / Fx l1 / Sio-4) TaxID=880071 RepID=I4AMV7_BERLS|nr:hydrolase [Bernardetia litoralis]AFM05292.1 penicillin-binding protein, beta-lactamase class C [Bernardetia litoralis DSM 6794]
MKKSTKKIFLFSFFIVLALSVGGCVSWWQDWNVPKTMLQKRKLIESSLVLLHNKDNYIPLQNLSKERKVVVSISKASFSIFEENINLYADFTTFHIIPSEDSLKLAADFQSLDNFNEIVFLVGKDSISNFITRQITNFAIKKPVSVTVFENRNFIEKNQNQLLETNALLFCPVYNSISEELSAQLLCGGIGASGVLENEILPNFEEEKGVFTKKNRLKYTIPEEVGIKSQDLRLIDTLVLEAMNAKAMPSAQVLVAVKGNVIYQKAFGFHTYDSTTKAEKSDIYDLASVTKILASTTAYMNFYDQNRLPLDSTLSYFLPFFQGTNKDTLILKDILTHQAQLFPFIDFGHKETRNHKVYPRNVFRTKKEKGFETQLAENLFIKTDYYKENMLKIIANSKLWTTKEYKYSDLGFILAPEIIEKLAREEFSDFLQTHFYQPLSAPTLTFKPLEKFSRSRIVPTERDSLFRNELVWGNVHDEAAAMRGGISGHAGLFGNANDVAKLLQMFLNGGTYGETTFLKATTISEFTRCQFCEQGNRRGLGFDKPLLEWSPNGNTAKDASALSYGHFGFTGTMVWVDPATEMVFVFLSNRVYPTRNSKMLMNLNTRTRIQQVIYDAMK